MTTQSNILQQSSQHLNEEELSAFVDDPTASEYAALRLHIAGCGDCREKTRLLQESQHIVKDYAQTICTPPVSDLKSRLHATTHELAMQELPGVKGHSHRNKTSKPKKSSWLSAVFHMKINWLAVPATAVASMLAAWIMLTPHGATPTTEHTNSSQLVSFQDTQGLVFQKQVQPQPGLGFFHQSDQNIQPYTGFDIKLNPGEGTIAITWPKIDGVTHYQISLQKVSNNVSTELTRTQTEGTLWQVEQSLLTPGTLYRLHLSGRTAAELSFHYSGGFVFQ